MMDAQERAIKHIIKEALDLNVYRTASKKIYEGTTYVADNEEELYAILRKDSNQDIYLALEEKVRQAKQSIV